MESTQPSSRASRKAQRTSTSDSPSGSASNATGQFVVDQRLRSVLSHPLALRLWSILHGKDPSSLIPYGMLDCDVTAEKRAELDKILETAVDTWVKSSPRNEPELTRHMSSMLENSKTSFHSATEVNVICGNRPTPGRIDIMLSPGSKKPSTPLAIMEVGRNNLDWWKKVDQNFQYLVNLGDHQNDPCLRFKESLLFAVLTIEGEAGTNAQQQLRIKLGVFLCSPRNPEKREEGFRMILLSHCKTDDLQRASTAFGRLLQATLVLSCYRESKDQQAPTYQYFSSNCCKVGENVFRSYDNRFRQTDRSPEIYLAENCKDIVGGTPQFVVKYPDDFDPATFYDNGKSNSSDTRINSSYDPLWSTKYDERQKGLLVIATPYRRGIHVARSPKAFVPIITQLEQLHKNGFVHGDIRAYNTVFGEKDNEGWLIDFDFGGKCGSKCYPRGYRTGLADGGRVGQETMEIEKWHDWYALGQLIFNVHELVAPGSVSSKLSGLLLQMTQFWRYIKKEPSEKEIEDLKSFLLAIEKNGWKVIAGVAFRIDLEKTSNLNLTYATATGSPPKNKLRN